MTMLSWHRAGVSTQVVSSAFIIDEYTFFSSAVPTYLHGSRWHPSWPVLVECQDTRRQPILQEKKFILSHFRRIR